MTDMTKANQQASPKKTPLIDSNSHPQQLIVPLEAKGPCVVFPDDIDCLPFGTKPKQE